MESDVTVEEPNIKAAVSPASVTSSLSAVNTPLIRGNTDLVYS